MNQPRAIPHPNLYRSQGVLLALSERSAARPVGAVVAAAVNANERALVHSVHVANLAESDINTDTHDTPNVSHLAIRRDKRDHQYPHAWVHVNLAPIPWSAG